MMMDLINAFRRRDLSQRIAKAIERISKSIEGQVKIMNFCGTHEWTITHYGIRSLIPNNVELVAGPGCPVCITPGYYVDVAVQLAMDGVRVFTFGDAFRLPGSSSNSPRSLEEAKTLGADVKIVYSVLDAIKIASDGRESAFLAVGFETTAPATLAPLRYERIPTNMRFIMVHRLTPPIMRYVLDNFPESPIRGIIAPGHVSTITGAKAWEFIPREYGVPVVVSGFEPVDVLMSILEILRQLKEGKAELVNEYSRAVSWEGNQKAQRIMEETCCRVEAAWRGIGFVPDSGLGLKPEFKQYDALDSYGIPELTRERWENDLPPGCKCAEVTLGMATPSDCPLFMKKCRPSSPYGPCMVSSEGTCFIWAKFGGADVLRGIKEEIGP